MFKCENNLIWFDFSIDFTRDKSLVHSTGQSRREEKMNCKKKSTTCKINEFDL